ncbi:hypothetical protein [Halorarum salinum]|uniref:Uncharacterized protein n=1 Tax=Halorarum salinum TaxID=2743089 RepID=A0A7D5QAE3_9EURY|nr:hypothetical protein [Halobaculum salinum]QLG60900.1 hypothetical protein HUG12_03735 [Halobaculum salinum]
MPGDAAGPENDDAGEPAGRSGSERQSAELPRPPARFREADPTGASWWRVLAYATGAWVVVAALWSLPFLLGGVPAPSPAGGFGSAGGRAVTVVLGVAVLLRFVLLPSVLLRDASLVRASDEVAWTPRLSFYVPAVVVAASPTGLSYLLKRRRYVGNPGWEWGDGLAFYEGRTVPSNWWVVVAVGTAVGAAAEGLAVAVESRAPATAPVPAFSEDLGLALSGPILAALAGFLFLRLVLVPLAFYLDATAVRRADVGWRPLALWYAFGGLVLTLPFGLFYLYRRVRHTAVGPF